MTHVLVVHFKGHRDDPDATDMVITAGYSSRDYWVKKYSEAGWLSNWSSWVEVATDPALDKP